MKKALVVLTLVSAFLLAPFGAQARTIKSDPTRESLTKFNSQIVVGDDGMADVVEEITYDMGGVQHHGLERIIPIVQYIKDPSTGVKKYLNYDFKFLEAAEDGNANAPYTVSGKENGQVIVVRIGDANVTKTGIHTYRLRYSFGPITRRDNVADYISYNIVGFDWPIPVREVTATMTLQKPPILSQTYCYTGTSGSKASDCSVDILGNTVRVESRSPLAIGETISMEVDYPVGTFANVLGLAEQPSAKYADTDTSGGDLGSMKTVLWFMLIFFIMLVIGLIRFVVSKFREWTYKRKQTVIAHYESPDKLKPAEIGLLSDKAAGNRELTATLVDIAIRGYIRIREIKPKSFWSGAQYEFEILKDLTGLEKYELSVLSLVFVKTPLAKGSKAVLKREANYAREGILKTINEELKDRLEQKGYFLPRKFWKKQQKAAGKIHPRTMTIITIVGTIGLFIGLIIYLNGNFRIAEMLLYFGIAAMALFFMRPARYTKLGYEQWAKVKGFEQFMTVTEKDRMKFENAPEKTPALFNKLLPYAIALGVEKKWANQFADISLTAAQTGWYVGSTPYLNSTMLANDLNSSFVSSMSSTMGTSGSSMSGGGGAGGAGGGGGGGW